MWNGTMFVDLDWPLNASSLLSASAELLVIFDSTAIQPPFDSHSTALRPFDLPVVGCCTAA